MPLQRILATSGGFLPTGVGRNVEAGGIIRRALALTGRDRPKVCLLMTATGDDANYLLRTYQALSRAGCEVTHLEVFPMPNADPEELLLSSDLVWVGGGSVANLLALWQLHGIDTAMRHAWKAGVILGGVSAGSICWHVGGPTDSFGPLLRPITNGLALLPYANGVHYDSEPQRRPLLQALVAAGTLPTSYASDDGVGILYEGTEPVEVITDREVDPTTGAAAYRIERIDGIACETRLAPGRIARNA